MNSSMKKDFDRLCEDGDEALKTLNKYIAGQGAHYILDSEKATRRELVQHYLKPALCNQRGEGKDNDGIKWCWLSLKHFTYTLLRQNDELNRKITELELRTDSQNEYFVG